MPIIDTGKKRPKAGIHDWLELQSNRKHLVQRPIENMSRKKGDVLYGRHAVNNLLGAGYHRETYDYDVYSYHPRSHAIRIEKSIDRGTNSNLAYVDPMRIDVNGKKKTIFRVKTRHNDTVEVDYNFMPGDIRYETRRGVRYETLNRAHKKYSKMIRKGEINRFPKAFWDKDDIDTYRMIKKNKKRWR